MSNDWGFTLWIFTVMGVTAYLGGPWAFISLCAFGLSAYVVMKIDQAVYRDGYDE